MADQITSRELLGKARDLVRRVAFLRPAERRESPGRPPGDGVTGQEEPR